MGLLDLAVQTVDGAKVVANASKDRANDAAELRGLLARLDRAIAELEAQNEAGQDSVAVHLPKKLADKEVLRAHVRQAMDELASRGTPKVHQPDRHGRPADEE